MKLQFIGILSIFFLFCSCEKVIDIDLNESDPQIVIEANIHNNTDDCLVQMSLTEDYFSSDSYEMVDDATIILKSSDSEYSFTSTGNGNYVINGNNKLTPDTYELSVTVDDTVYEATSTMPDPVPLSYLTSEYKSANILTDAGYVVYYSFIDPEDETNYYRIRYKLNGELQSDVDDYNLLSDELFNGNSIQIQMDAANRFEKGDTIEVEFMSIDESTYNYFNTLLDILTQSTMESTPSNPTSNFSNDALGYFSAYSSDTKTIIIGEGISTN